jgi:hypothetical protein
MIFSKLRNAIQIFDGGGAWDISEHDDIFGSGKGAAGSVAWGGADTLRRL